MNAKLFWKCSLAFITIVITAWLLSSWIDTIYYESAFDSTYSSPSGVRSVLVRYDYVSRPSVFMNGERLFEYRGSGFNETVAWDVTWISEQRIMLSYDDSDDAYDEEFYIDIP